MVSEFLSKKHIDYRWPQFSDFWVTGVTTIACLIIEMIFDKIFYQVFYLNCKEKVNEGFMLSENDLINGKYVLLGKGKKNNYILIAE